MEADRLNVWRTFFSTSINAFKLVENICFSINLAFKPSDSHFKIKALLQEGYDEIYKETPNMEILESIFTRMKELGENLKSDGKN